MTQLRTVFEATARSLRERAVLLCVAGLFALAGCSPDPAPPQPDARPPLFEITGPDGAVEGWMLGTIHALPDGVGWRTSAVETVLSEADYLIVEIADLESGQSADLFRQMASTPGQPAIEQKVAPSLRPQLLELLDRIDAIPAQFGSIETWAAALSLAQASAHGDPANGVDRLVIREFSDRGVEEFEGAAAQLAIFDSLAEQDQRELLEGVVRDSVEAEADPGRLQRAWLTGDEGVLEDATRTGIMADPELREALLVNRNEAWMRRLLGDLRAEAKPLVAVGAGHLVGTDGLPAQLEAKGYTVRSLH